MPLTDSEKDVLREVAHVGGSLSLVGCSYVVFKYTRSAPSLTADLVVILSILDALGGLFFSFSQDPIDSYGWCQAQAFGIQMFGLASVRFFNNRFAP